MKVKHRFTEFGRRRSATLTITGATVLLNDLWSDYGPDSERFNHPKLVVEYNRISSAFYRERKDTYMIVRYQRHAPSGTYPDTSGRMPWGPCYGSCAEMTDDIKTHALHLDAFRLSRRDAEAIAVGYAIHNLRSSLADRSRCELRDDIRALEAAGVTVEVHRYDARGNKHEASIDDLTEKEAA